MNQGPTATNRVVVKDIGGFQLVKEIGEGGMGKVFLARQQSLDRMVALKVLQPDLANDAEFVARFHREARAAALFQHPNITAVIDAGQDPRSGVHFIAFEFLSGASLEDALKKHGTLKEEQVLHVLKGCVSGLRFAETKGLVHRDIKPDNILFDAHGTPKLADLGLARRYDADDNSKQVTQTGVVLGTPVYMAPEQALGEKDLDIRADIYALGLCAWRCLAGVIPFDEDRTASALQILSRHINQDLTDIRRKRADTSERMALLIMGMTHRDRDSRYLSASALAKDLERVIGGKLPEGPAGDPAIHTTLIGAATPDLALAEEPAAAAPAASPDAARASGAKRGGAVRAQSTSSSQRLAEAAKAGPSVGLAVGVLGVALVLGIGLAMMLGRKKATPPSPQPSESAAPTQVAVSPTEAPVRPSPRTRRPPPPPPPPVERPPRQSTPAPSQPRSTDPHGGRPQPGPNGGQQPGPGNPGGGQPELGPPNGGRPPFPGRGFQPPEFVREGNETLRALVEDFRSAPDKLEALQAKFAQAAPRWPRHELDPAQASLELLATFLGLLTEGIAPRSPEWTERTEIYRQRWAKSFGGSPPESLGERPTPDKLDTMLKSLGRLNRLKATLLADQPPQRPSELHDAILATAFRLQFTRDAYRLAALIRNPEMRTKLGEGLSAFPLGEPNMSFWKRTSPTLLRLVTAWPESELDHRHAPAILNELRELERTALGRLLHRDLLQARLVLEELTVDGSSMGGAWLRARHRYASSGEPIERGDLFQVWLSEEPDEPVRGALVELRKAPSKTKPLIFDMLPQQFANSWTGPAPIARLGKKEAQIKALGTQGGDQELASVRFAPKSNSVLVVEFDGERTLLLQTFTHDALGSEAETRAGSEIPQARLELPQHALMFGGPLRMRPHAGATSTVYLLAPRTEEWAERFKAWAERLQQRRERQDERRGRRLPGGGRKPGQGR